MTQQDFRKLPNVRITGTDLSSLKEEEMAILNAQARYCQAMTEADTVTMGQLVSEDKVYTHMSGRTQSREEYFKDVEKGRLRYERIGIEDPVIRTDGEYGSITYTAVLTADAYGARGTFRMKGTHRYELREGRWIEING